MRGCVIFFNILFCLDPLLGLPGDGKEISFAKTELLAIKEQLLAGVGHLVGDLAVDVAGVLVPRLVGEEGHGITSSN